MAGQMGQVKITTQNLKIVGAAADGFGIRKYDGKTFTSYTTENGLCDNNVAEIMEDKKGNIWVGTMYGGVSRYDGKTFTNFTRNGEISGDEVYGFYEDKNDTSGLQLKTPECTDMTEVHLQFSMQRMDLRQTGYRQFMKIKKEDSGSAAGKVFFVLTVKLFSR